MTERLQEDHDNAARLARKLADLPGIRLCPAAPLTNMVFFELDHPALTARPFITAAAARGLRVEELGAGRIRAVTHAGISAADIDRAVEIIDSVLSAGGAGYGG